MSIRASTLYDNLATSAPNSQIIAQYITLYYLSGCGIGLYPKAFCKIVPDFLGGDPEYCNIMHADGAGTSRSCVNPEISGRTQLYHQSPIVQEPNRLSPIFTGKKRVTLPFGRALLRMH